ncbi:MAG: hypothetical protein PHY43_04570 [Verrucomicrobiales bacterium]|nr:hypothetical protein [Verrucomicrobiales bacterium]
MSDFGTHAILADWIFSTTYYGIDTERKTCQKWNKQMTPMEKSNKHTTPMKISKALLGILTITFGVLFHVPAQTFLTNGLLAYYPFNGNANDASGNGNNATPAGNFQFVSTGLGRTAFRGIGDNSQFYSGGGHVLLPTFSSSLNSGLTVSLWVRDEVEGTGAADTEQYIDLGAADLPTLEITLHGDGAVYFGMRADGSGVGPYAVFRMPVDLQTYPASGWKHLVLAYQPGSFACYFNGQKLYQTNVTVNIFPVVRAALNRHWWDNGASSSARMSATYQNVRIYNRALSDNEVQQLYAIELEPLIGLQKFVKPTFSHLSLGTNYQMQVSGDLNTWTNQGTAFTATNVNMVYPQYFDVDNWSQLFFRLQVPP